MSPAEWATVTQEALERGLPTELIGLSTGLSELDVALLGLAPSELYVLGDYSARRAGGWLSRQRCDLQLRWRPDLLSGHVAGKLSMRRPEGSASDVAVPAEGRTVVRRRAVHPSTSPPVVSPCPCRTLMRRSSCARARRWCRIATPILPAKLRSACSTPIPRCLRSSRTVDWRTRFDSCNYFTTRLLLDSRKVSHAQPRNR
jgi:hypothetical protein